MRLGAILASGLLAAITSGSRAQDLTSNVVINEIFYRPVHREDRLEFIELHNRSDRAVDLSGWTFKRGIQFTFARGSGIEPGGFEVVAEDPARLETEFGVAAHGPYSGRLANEGETIELRDADDGLVDRVKYDVVFPWPFVPETSGYSIQLLNPRLDNDRPGNWTASGEPADPHPDVLIEAGSTWRFAKGASDLSSPPSAWREPEFDVSRWQEGPAPIGYGEDFIKTKLADKAIGRPSMFLRREFELSGADVFRALSLDVRYDDGFLAWINGSLVAHGGVYSTETPPEAVTSSGRSEHGWTRFSIRLPEGILREGRNSLAVQAHNNSILRGGDAFFDARLTAFREPWPGPWPGRANVAPLEELAPRLHALSHEPAAPSSSEPVEIIADFESSKRIESAAIRYQVVEPGSYIALGSEEFQGSWASMPMRRVEGESTGGDHSVRFIGEIPADIQRHRRLVRYRVEASAAGSTLARPSPADSTPNLAYFVYDGVPGWDGAIDPASEDPALAEITTTSAGVMRALPAYHLITKSEWVERSQFTERYMGDNYKWRGALVVGDQVYDHVRFRPRGGVHRFDKGKNMWKFDFRDGHELRANDDHGRQYRTRWAKLNLSPGFHYAREGRSHRGEAGMNEAASYRLFNLAGVAAPKTHWLQLRVIDAEAEAGPTQYEGDFWGVYLAVEQMGGRFLEEHGLPDGNLYKMENQQGELHAHASGSPADGSDVRAFVETLRQGTPDEAWWLENFDLTGYFSYNAIIESVQHYDLGFGRNCYYYHRPHPFEPNRRLWSVLPWDVDLTWDRRETGGFDPFVVGMLRLPAFKTANRQRIREVRDLLFNSDQAGQLIDELASILAPNGSGASIIDADRARWDYAPILESEWIEPTRTGKGLFYQATEEKSFAGVAAMMKEFVDERAEWIDANLLEGFRTPEMPRLTDLSAEAHPAGGLRFATSPIEGGTGGFYAMQWRIGEVSPLQAPPGPRRYEIEPVWTSEMLRVFNEEISIPPDAIEPGRRYRVRARLMDSAGEWSHWSEPIEFTPSSATRIGPGDIIISEFFADADGPDEGREWIELANATDRDIDITGLVLADNDDDRHRIEAAAALVVKAGGFVVLASSTDSETGRAIGAAYGYGDDLTLGNRNDELVLLFGGVEIDSIGYGEFKTEPHPILKKVGKAPEKGRSLGAHLVDSRGENGTWSLQTSLIPGTRSRGTPGGANDRRP